MTRFGSAIDTSVTSEGAEVSIANEGTATIERY
jgi:hypothetical protein